MSLPLAAMILFAVLLAPMLGCSESSSPEPEPEGPSLSGTVTIVGSGVPLNGAQLVLVDGTTNVVAAGPVTSGSDGSYRFVNPPSGSFHLLVYHPQYFVYDRTAPRVTIEDGPVDFDMRMTRSELWNGSGYAIEGTVYDADSGEPIAGAFVGMSSGDFSYLFLGVGPPNQAVSDSSGRFVLKGVWVAGDEYGPLALFPIVATKEGYEPAATPFLQIPDGPDSTAHRDMQLHRPTGTSVLAGTVYSEGKPKAGIVVGLDFYDMGIPGARGAQMLAERARSGRPVAKEAGAVVPIAGRTVATDSTGSWRFDQLPPGTYTAVPAYLPDDGFVTDSENDPIDLGVADTVETVLLNIVRAIRPLAPLPGTVVEGPRPLLKWELPARADRVVLALTTGHILDEWEYLLGGVGEFQPPDSLPSGANIRWSVYVYWKSNLIGRFEEVSTFKVP